MRKQYLYIKIGAHPYMGRRTPIYILYKKYISLKNSLCSANPDISQPYDISPWLSISN